MTKRPFPETEAHGPPFIIAHRGASGVALENSFEAFRRARALADDDRCRGIELDIHATLDGKLVVHHDPVLGNGEVIAQLPWSRVRANRLADGSEIPLLADVLAVAGDLTLFVEAKGLPESADLALLATAAAASPGQVHIHAFDHRIIHRLRGQHPTLPLGVLSRSYPVDPVSQVRDAGATTLWQDKEFVDQSLIERCHQAGIALVVWTVNDATHAAALLRMGVNAICTDWPDRLG